MRVAIVDDQELIVSAFEILVNNIEGLEVVATGSTGLDAIDLVQEAHGSATPIEVILMDIRMPLLDGIAATRRIHVIAPATKVLALTTFSEDAYVRGALEAGAHGYLLKDASLQELEDAVRTVASGGFYEPYRVWCRFLS